MILHQNAALTLRKRNQLVHYVAAGATVTAAALLVGCSRQTASKWVGRARRGEPLEDRSSRPRRQPRRSSCWVELAVLAARDELEKGPWPLAFELGLGASTIYKILRRHGKSRLPQPEREPVIRYERERPGELVHFDVKKLNRFNKPGHALTGARALGESRGAGWEYLFVAIDDASRLGFAAFYPDETKASSFDFAERALAFFASHGIKVERVLTDNGACFKSRFTRQLERLGVSHRRTRPYRPQTNGKAERFIRTLLGEWAYARSYASSEERRCYLEPWLGHYNSNRRHRALGGKTPLEAVNNLCESYT